MPLDLRHCLGKKTFRPHHRFADPYSFRDLLYYPIDIHISILSYTKICCPNDPALNNPSFPSTLMSPNPLFCCTLTTSRLAKTKTSKNIFTASSLLTAP